MHIMGPIVAQGHKGMTGCGFDSHSRKLNIKYFNFLTLVQSDTTLVNTASSPATQHTILLELGGKWETEFNNTRFPLPTLLCVRNSVKILIKKSHKCAPLMFI